VEKARFTETIELGAQEYSWIIKESRKFNMSPRRYIAELIRKMYEASRDGKCPYSALSCIVEIVICPICYEKFPDKMSAIKHIEEKHPELKKVGM
jgi:hypothetical protein